jgi:hypothetical protein
MAKVNVSGGYDAAVETISLDTGERAKLPTPTYKLLWWDATNYSDPWDDPKWEIVEVSAHPGAADDLTVIRGSETAYGGKAASTKNTGSASYKMANVMTAYNWERLRQRCAFRAHRNGVDQTAVLTATTTKVLFNAEDYDVVSQNYDTTNSKFVAPRAMILHVDAAVQLTSLDGDDDEVLWVYIYSGPTGSLTLHSYTQTHAGVHTHDSLTGHISDNLSLSASDEVEIRARHNVTGASPGSDRTINGSSTESWFSGFEVLPQ